MTWSLVASLVAVLAVVAVAGGALRRSSIERERRRVAALTALADRLGQISATHDLPAAAIEPPPRAPRPLTPIRSRGRAALLDALAEAVGRAASERSRLAIALVESPGAAAAALADDVEAIAGAQAYEVGPRSVALVAPGVGRAEALGLLARVQAATGATGTAVELERDEDAVALLTRLLSAARPERA